MPTMRGTYFLHSNPSETILMRKLFALLPALIFGLVLSVGCTPAEDNSDVDTSLDPMVVDPGTSMGDNMTNAAMMPGDNTTNGADMPVVVETPE